MAKNANLYIRVDQDIKTRAEQLFASFGITVTDAVNMFLHKAIMVGGLPFDVLIPKLNEETLAAIKEVQEMKKDPSMGKSYTDVDEMMKESLALHENKKLKQTKNSKRAPIKQKREATKNN